MNESELESSNQTSKNLNVIVTIIFRFMYTYVHIFEFMKEFSCDCFQNNKSIRVGSEKLYIF